MDTLNTFRTPEATKHQRTLPTAQKTGLSAETFGDSLSKPTGQRDTL